MQVFFKASMALLALCAGPIAVAEKDTSQAEPPVPTQAPPSTQTAPAVPPAGGQSQRMTQEDRARLQTKKHLPQQTVATTPAPVGAESSPLPDTIRARVLADAAKRMGTRASDPAIVESVAVTWPDGSLGCPERNVDYPQLPTAGYRVVVRGDGKTYDYRIAVPPGAANRAGATQGAVESPQIRLCDPMRNLDPLGR